MRRDTRHPTPDTRPDRHPPFQLRPRQKTEPLPLPPAKHLECLAKHVENHSDSDRAEREGCVNTRRSSLGGNGQGTTTTSRDNPQSTTANGQPISPQTETETPETRSEGSVIRHYLIDWIGNGPVLATTEATRMLPRKVAFHCDSFIAATLLLPSLPAARRYTAPG